MAALVPALATAFACAPRAADAAERITGGLPVSGACTLSGVATFDPPLRATPGTITISISVSGGCLGVGVPAGNRVTLSFSGTVGLASCAAVEGGVAGEAFFGPAPQNGFSGLATLAGDAGALTLTMGSVSEGFVGEADMALTSVVADASGCADGGMSSATITGTLTFAST